MRDDWPKPKDRYQLKSGNVVVVVKVMERHHGDFFACEYVDGSGKPFVSTVLRHGATFSLEFLRKHCTRVAT